MTNLKLCVPELLSHTKTKPSYIRGDGEEYERVFHVGYQKSERSSWL